MPAIVDAVRPAGGDGKYAIFRIHYRRKDSVFWQTLTEDVKTTKGSSAPVTLNVRRFRKCDNWTG